MPWSSRAKSSASIFAGRPSRGADDVRLIGKTGSSQGLERRSCVCGLPWAVPSELAWIRSSPQAKQRLSGRGVAGPADHPGSHLGEVFRSRLARHAWDQCPDVSRPRGTLPRRVFDCAREFGDQVSALQRCRPRQGLKSIAYRHRAFGGLGAALLFEFHSVGYPDRPAVVAPALCSETLSQALMDSLVEHVLQEPGIGQNSVSCG